MQNHLPQPIVKQPSSELKQAALIETQFSEADFIHLLKSSDFLPSQCLLPDPSRQQLSFLLRVIHRIYISWYDQCDQFKLKTVHNALIFLVEKIASNDFKGLISIEKTNHLFFELNNLFTYYAPHYTDIKTSRLVPIHQLLLKLSEKFYKSPKEEPYLFISIIHNLLCTWVKHNSISVTVLAQCVRALGELALKGLFGNSESQKINLNHLLYWFVNNSKNSRIEDILFIFKGLSDLGFAGILKPVSINHINEILKKLSKQNLALSMSELSGFFKFLAKLFDQVNVAYPDLLNYKFLEKILNQHDLKNIASEVKIANLACDIFIILNASNVQINPNFSILEDMLLSLNNINSEYKFSYHGCIRKARSIGLTIYYLGEIIKLKPILYTKMSKKIEKYVENLFDILKDIYDNFMLCKTDENFHDDFEKIINAVISALRGSVLMGISIPCVASQYLAAALNDHLSRLKPTDLAEKYNILISQYALFIYVTQTKKSQFAPWLEKALDLQKPKMPEPHTCHGRAIKILKNKGCKILPEKSYGIYPIDIYCEYKGRIELFEINGPNHTSSKDLYKAFVIKYKEGLNINYFNAGEEYKIFKVLENKSPSQDLQTVTSSKQLYEFIVETSPKNKDVWTKKEGFKIASATDLVSKSDSQSLEIWANLLGADFQDFSLEHKQKKPKINTKYSAAQLIDFATCGDLDMLKKCLAQGDLENPATGQKDPYTRLVALLCAMQAASMISDGAKKNNILEIIKFLIFNLSLTHLTAVIDGISPLILALRWKDVLPGIDQFIYEKFSQSKKHSKPKKDERQPDKCLINFDLIIEQAKELSNILVVVPKLIPQKLFLLKEADSDVGNKQNLQDDKNAQFNLQISAIEETEDHKREDLPPRVIVRKAEQNDDFAQFQLMANKFTSMKKNSISQKRNCIKTIFQMMDRMALQDYAPAQHWIGTICHNYGRILKDQNYITQSIFYFEMASAQGYLKAQLYLGKMYYLGIDVKIDIPKSISHFEKAAKMGSINAQYNLAVIYFGDKNRKRNLNLAKYYAELAALQNDSKAQLALGIIYCYHSTDNEENRKSALHYFRLAALQGDASAQFNMGKCYEQGIGTQKDLKESKKYYKMAAAQGHNRAKILLSTMIDEKCDKNSEWETSSVSDSSDSESVFSEKSLHCFRKELTKLKSEKVSKDILDSAKLYVSTAEEKYSSMAEFNYRLAMKYKKKGGDKNLSSCAEFLQKSAKEKYPAAFFQLGLMFERGLRFHRDKNQAISHYRQAAELGYPKAIDKLKLLAPEMAYLPQASTTIIPSDGKMGLTSKLDSATQFSKFFIEEISTLLANMQTTLIDEKSKFKELIMTNSYSYPNLTKFDILLFYVESFIDYLKYLLNRAKKLNPSSIFPGINDLEINLLTYYKIINKSKAIMVKELEIIELIYFADKTPHQYQETLLELNEIIGQKQRSLDFDAYHESLNRLILLMNIARFNKDQLPHRKINLDAPYHYNREIIYILVNQLACAALQRKPLALVCLQPLGYPWRRRRLGGEILLLMKSLLDEIKTNIRSMICVICDGWGLTPSYHFVINLVIDNTLVIIDPLVKLSDKSTELDLIKEAARKAGIQEMVLANNPLQDAKIPKNSAGLISVMFTEKLVQLGYDEVKKWLLDKATTITKISAQTQKNYTVKNIGALLLQKTLGDQEDYLINLLQNYENYLSIFDQIIARHASRLPKSEEQKQASLMSPVQVIFQQWVFGTHIKNYTLAKIKTEDRENGENCLRDLQRAINPPKSQLPGK